MISKQQVQHIANLANLFLTKQEIKKFQKQLGDILDYIEILNELDTKEAEPTSQVTGLENIFREDKINNHLSQNDALSGAKSKHKGYFKISEFGKFRNL